jgi:hypothetical protein
MPITSGEVGLGGLLVGAAGLIAGQLQTARADKRAERRLHAQWLRDRRADAYVDVLGVAEKCGQWAQLIDPIVDGSPPRPVPPLASPDDQGRVEALLAAFGSDTVRDRYTSWRSALLDIITQHKKIEFARLTSTASVPPVEDEGTLLLQLEEKVRVSERVAREDLGDAVSAELGPDNVLTRRFWQRA